MTAPNRRIPQLLYNGVLLPLGTACAHCLKPFNRKIADTLAARRGWRERWKEGTGRITARPVWFHVSSVGEFEQARPLISILQRHAPEIPVAVTFLSPSGYVFAMKKETLDDRNNIKFIDYLPFDFESNARFCLAQLRPRALVFVKFDLWPNLIRLARADGVPLLLIDATLSEASYRNSRLGRALYAPVYADLDTILAISPADAERFRLSCPGHAGIAVTGDTRFDRVAQRERRRIDFPIDTAGRTVFIAGSIWPEDEARILPALELLAREHDDLALIMAPHEPTERHVAGLIRWARRQRLTVERLSTLDHGSRARVIVIDTVGVLAELYRIADLAYVGGSFSTGVHNVIEPAIMGIPVLFGPVHKNSFEALELIARGGGIGISTADDARVSFGGLIADGERRQTMGRNARSYVDSQLGASERCWQALSPHILKEQNGK